MSGTSPCSYATPFDSYAGAPSLSLDRLHTAGIYISIMKTLINHTISTQPQFIWNISRVLMHGLMDEGFVTHFTSQGNNNRGFRLLAGLVYPFQSLCLIDRSNSGWVSNTARLLLYHRY